MSRSPNLLRHDYEAIAEKVSERARHDGAVLVVVLKTGSVKYDLPDAIGNYPTDCVLSIYTRSVLVNEIEDDLLFRLRELKA